MNIRHALAIALVALFAAPATAGEQQEGIRALAEQSGLSESQVRMVLAGRSTMHHRFPLYFDRAEEKLVRSIGKDNYARLTDGDSIAVLKQAPADDGTAVADLGKR